MKFQEIVTATSGNITLATIFDVKNHRKRNFSALIILSYNIKLQEKLITYGIVPHIRKTSHFIDFFLDHTKTF